MRWYRASAGFKGEGTKRKRGRSGQGESNSELGAFLNKKTVEIEERATAAARPAIDIGVALSNKHGGSNTHTDTAQAQDLDAEKYEENAGRRLCTTTASFGLGLKKVGEMPHVGAVFENIKLTPTRSQRLTTADGLTASSIIAHARILWCVRQGSLRLKRLYMSWVLTNDVEGRYTELATVRTQPGELSTVVFPQLQHETIRKMDCLNTIGRLIRSSEHGLRGNAKQRIETGRKFGLNTLGPISSSELQCFFGWGASDLRLSSMK